LAGCDFFVKRDAEWTKTGVNVVSPMKVE